MNEFSGRLTDDIVRGMALDGSHAQNRVISENQYDEWLFDHDSDNDLLIFKCHDMNIFTPEIIEPMMNVIDHASLEISDEEDHDGADSNLGFVLGLKRFMRSLNDSIHEEDLSDDVIRQMNEFHCIVLKDLFLEYSGMKMNHRERYSFAYSEGMSFGFSVMMNVYERIRSYVS